MRRSLLSLIPAAVLLLAACSPQQVIQQAQRARDDVAGMINPTSTAAVALDAATPDAAGISAASAATVTPAPTALPTLEPAAAATAQAERGAKRTKCVDDLPGGYKEGRNVECYFVTVPESRGAAAAASDRTIRLMVMRIKARTAAPQDPLFYLSGGPGGSGVKEGLYLLSKVLSQFVSTRDIVLVDQRGTGRSQPSMSCGEAYDLRIEFVGRRKKDDAQTTKYFDALRECARRLTEDGHSLAAYNSTENAADIDAVRAALGYPKMTLWGTSYGTTLALTIMRNHGAHISATVLEAVAPPQINLLNERAASIDQALATLLDGCAQSDVCSDTYPDLEQDLYRVVDRMNKRPIDVPGSEKGRKVRVTGDDLVGLIFQSLYSSEMIPYLPKLIDNIKKGDYRVLADVYRYADFTGDSVAAGMHYAVMCAEEAAHTTPSAVRAGFDDKPRLKSLFASDGFEDYFDLCTRWGVQAAPESAVAPVVSDVPTLVLSGRYDPITPPAWGELAAQTLSRSYVFSFDAAGHGVAVAGQKCALSIVRAFFKNPDSAPDGACMKTVKPVRFYVD